MCQLSSSFFGAPTPLRLLNHHVVNADPSFTEAVRPHSQVGGLSTAQHLARHTPSSHASHANTSITTISQELNHLALTRTVTFHL